jgi:hypothetical protein
MKAITLWNPWAYFVWLAGHPDPEVAKLGKHNETRSWYTSYRGPLAIHAGKTIPAFAEELCETELYFKIALRGAGIKFTGDIPLKTLIPCGAVLCTCKLVGCLRVRATRIAKRGGRPVRVAYLEAKNSLVEVTGRELAFGDYAPGRYAWILEDIKPLPEPIPARGQQGLWNWEPEVSYD